MGKSASERAVIARAATVPLLKAQPVSHTSCATAQGLRFCFQHSNRRPVMTIVRYEPWALLSRFQQQFDRAVGESADSADSASVSWIPHVDVREEAERFVVVADVPGVEGKDIEITADKGVLTIRGERRSEKKTSADGFERVERANGTFLRRFTLPESADAEAIKARHVNGVLEVTIPKRPQEQPRRISVQAA
jgi:HSP20 family protein